MTKDKLDRANAINNKLMSVKAFLEELNLTDPSGIDTTERYSPVTISCGMAQTITFDVANDDDPHNDVQRLDDNIRKTLVRILTDYKNQLERLFGEV